MTYELNICKWQRMTWRYVNSSNVMLPYADNVESVSNVIKRNLINLGIHATVNSKANTYEVVFNSEEDMNLFKLIVNMELIDREPMDRYPIGPVYRIDIL